MSTIQEILNDVYEDGALKTSGGGGGDAVWGDITGDVEDQTDVQPKLVSGTNIKTVNNESLLGDGNIDIAGGESVWDENSTEVVPKNAKNVTIPEDKAISTDTLKGEPVDGNNLIANSELTNWTSMPNSWDYDLFRAPIQSEDSDTGDYAVQFPVAVSGNDAPEIKQTVTVIAEDDYDPSLRVKDGDVIFAVYYLDGENQMYWQFSGDNIGTWVQSGLEPTAAYTCEGGDGAYATCTPTTFTVPAGVTEVTLRLLSIEEAIMDNVKLIAEDTSDVVVNGGFEDWTEVFPTGFLASGLGDEGDSDGQCVKEEVDFHSTPYSAKIVQDSTSPNFIFLTALTGFTTGDIGKFKFWAKEGTTSDLKMMLWDGLDGGNVFMWGGEYINTWVPLTEDVFSDPNAYKTFTLTDEWVQYEIEAPANSDNLIAIFLGGDTLSSTYYLDDIEGYKVESEAVTYHKFLMKTNAADSTASDALIGVKSADDYSMFRVGARGAISSSAVQTWDFGTKQVKVGASTNPNSTLIESALNGFSGAKLFRISGEIDVKETGETNVMQVRAGYRFLPMFISAETIGADTLSADATIILKDETQTLCNITYSDTLGESMPVDLTKGFKMSEEGGDISIEVTIADSGTSGGIKVYLVGTLIYEENENLN
jgi:hypothetical protein